MVYKVEKVGHRSWCRICCVCSLNNSAKEGEKKKHPPRNPCISLSKVLSQTTPSIPFLPFPFASAFFLLFGYSVVLLHDFFSLPLLCFFFFFWQSRHDNIVLCLPSFILTGSWLKKKNPHNEVAWEKRQLLFKLQIKYECGLFAVISCPVMCQRATSA